ncbi:MAG: glucose-6-phosphate isomerase, partial [Phycisphaerae bacterium]|nr:glucose-6-phosphate isomerase [Phycisphaerae bacterium]
MIKVRYKNVLQDQVGPAGYPLAQIEQAAAQAEHAVKTIKAEQSKRLYRRLPFNEQAIQQVLGVRNRLAPGCANLVVLGIGGSALGNIALQRALRPPFHNLMPADKRGGPRLFVMDNIDPATLSNLLDLIGGELDRTIFNVISKSGETAETASQFLIIRSILKRRYGGNFSDRVVAITDSKSGTMRTIADDEGYVTLPVPDGVGGRF